MLNERDESTQNKQRILLGSPVHQKPRILAQFLNSLKELKTASIHLNYFLVDDNESEQSRIMLRDFAEDSDNVILHASEQVESYICNEESHLWKEGLIWKVASFKDMIIQEAINSNYDYLFLVDSDLVLNPNTIEHLITLNKDIVSEVFWTKWQPNFPELPQVWLSDHYTLFPRRRGEQISNEEASTRQEQFIRQLRIPGVYEVGGLGACTLISRKALLAGVKFKEIKNVSFQGEDRHFCIRAAALGFSLFVDTHFQAYHIYRESDLEGVEKFKQENGLTKISSVELPSEGDSINLSSPSPTKPSLSLCMIVKNEADDLPRCLASVKPYVDEIIVVDTGSQDGTPELALKYGAKVSYFEWCDDFAAARNYAISQASCDWILVLDADEELIWESEEFWEQLTSDRENIAYTLQLNNVPDIDTTTYVLRLFRNTSDIRYVGRFHEMPKYQNQDITLNKGSHMKGVRIIHYGYEKEKLLQKHISRNRRMLERIREEEGLSLRLLYDLAKVYDSIEQPEKAQECYAEAMDRLLPNLIAGDKPEPFNFVPSLVFNLGIRSLKQNDYETARLLCQRGLEWCPDYPSLNYLAAVILRDLGFKQGAITYFENCIRLGQEQSYYKGCPFDLNFITIYPADELGNTYMEMERPLEALAAFELALSFDANFTAAKEKIDKIKELLATNP